MTQQIKHKLHNICPGDAFIRRNGEICVVQEVIHGTTQGGGYIMRYRFHGFDVVGVAAMRWVFDIHRDGESGYSPYLTGSYSAVNGYAPRPAKIA